MILSCEVFIGGARFSDTGAELVALEPTALDGLTISWGRETTVDQPDVSTCQFTVQDRLSGESFLETLGVGKTVEVYSTGEVPADAAGAETMQNGGFEGIAVGTDLIANRRMGRYLSSVSAVVGSIAATGTRAASVARLAADTTMQTTLPPAAFTSVIGGWDSIPRATPNPEAGGSDYWGFGISILPPLHTRIRVYFGIWTDPNVVTTSTYIPIKSTIPGTEGWQRLTGSVRVGYDGWVGFYIDVDQSSYARWDTLPASWDSTPDTWNDYGFDYSIDDASITAPPSTRRRVFVWGGRITDMEASALPDSSGSEIRVTAADFLAELNNDYVGDQPWLVEPMSTRANRIVDLAAIGVTTRIDPSLGSKLVSWRDVDNQSAGGLLTELGTTTDGIMWSAAHTGFGTYLWFQDSTLRLSPAYLQFDGSVWVIAAGGSASGIELSACSVLQEPVSWRQDVSDVITRVDVSWLEQGTGDDGKPTTTERTVSSIDAATEANFGVHRMGIGTQLVSAVDAAAIAENVLVRSRDVKWRIDGISWDTQFPRDSSDEIKAALDLLDGTLKLGIPITISELPEWSPFGSYVGVFLEGGTYEFTGGRWILTLATSSAGAQGKSLEWNEAPAATWNSMSPDIDWRDMYGVGVAPA